MPHYWFSHRANIQFNVPSQWSRTDIIQPRPPSQTWQMEINGLLNKTALLFIDFTDSMNISLTYGHHNGPECKDTFCFVFSCGGRCVAPCDQAVVSGVVCRWKSHNRCSKSKAAVRKMSVDERKSKAAAFVTRAGRDLKCLEGSYTIMSSANWKVQWPFFV